MAKTFKTVDAYIASQPPAVRFLLARVRAAIREAVPSAEETISYAMPTYKLNGTPLIYFAGWKQHYSLYPSTDRILAELEADLAGYKVQKGTIRFPLTEPVPVKLIGNIARIRAGEVASRPGRKKPAR